MKKFFQIVVSIKERTALCYTAAMCFYLFFLFVFKQEGASLPHLFSLLVVSVAAGTMQLAAFSDLLFKKLAYGWRLVWFAVTCTGRAGKRNNKSPGGGESARAFHLFTMFSHLLEQFDLLA